MDINLLPWRANARRRRGQRMLWSLIVLLLALMVVLIIVNQRLKKLEMNERMMATQLDDHWQMLHKKRCVTDSADVQKQRHIQKQMRQYATRNAQMYQAIGQITHRLPIHIRLTSLILRGQKIMLKGLARNPTDINLMLKLAPALHLRSLMKHAERCQFTMEATLH